MFPFRLAPDLVLLADDLVSIRRGIKFVVFSLITGISLSIFSDVGGVCSYIGDVGFTGLGVSKISGSVDRSSVVFKSVAVLNLPVMFRGLSSSLSFSSSEILPASASNQSGFKICSLPLKHRGVAYLV